MAPSGFCPEKRLPRYPFGHAERTCYDVCAEFFSVQKSLPPIFLLHYGNSKLDQIFCKQMPKQVRHDSFFYSPTKPTILQRENASPSLPLPCQQIPSHGGRVSSVRIFLGRTPPWRGQPQGWLRKQWSRKAEPRNGGGAKGLAVELARKCLVEPLGLPSKKKKSTKNRNKCTFLPQNSV